MRLVETIAGELFDQIEEVFGNRDINVTFLRAVDVLLFVFGDDGQLLFADRFNALIRLAKRDAADAVQNPHHLFLVNHHAVGFFQNRVDHRMNLRGLLPLVLHVDIVHDHAAFERPWPVQSTRRDDVCECVGLHLLKEVSNSPGLKLEDPFCFAALEQRERLRVVEWKLQWVDLLAGRLLNILNGLVQNREIPQAQKVHLQQAGRFDVIAVPLRNKVFLAGDPLQR